MPFGVRLALLKVAPQVLDFGPGLRQLRLARRCERTLVLELLFARVRGVAQLADLLLPRRGRLALLREPRSVLLQIASSLLELRIALLERGARLRKLCLRVGHPSPQLVELHGPRRRRLAMPFGVRLALLKIAPQLLDRRPRLRGLGLAARRERALILQLARAFLPRRTQLVGLCAPRRGELALLRELRLVLCDGRAQLVGLARALLELSAASRQRGAQLFDFGAVPLDRGA